MRRAGLWKINVSTYINFWGNLFTLDFKFLHMKKLFVLLALFLSGHTYAQTADDIINKYLAATGGADKWSKVTSIKTTGYYVMGPGMNAPVSEVQINKPFLGHYNDFTWQGMTNKSSMRADSGWNYNPFGGKRETDPMSAEQIRRNKIEADPQGLLINYKAKGYTVDYLGTDDMDGTEVIKLRLTTKDGDMIYYYFDAETYYLLKITSRLKFKDKEDKSSITFSDFRKTDYGITVPFSAQAVDDNGAEQGGPVIVNKIEVNSAPDLSVFEKPKL
jgi:hypothetical protein